MIRKALLTVGGLALAITGFAQRPEKCATDGFYREQVAKHPEILQQKARLDQDITNSLRGIPNLINAKGTRSIDSTAWAEDTAQMHIPVVFHVISDFSGPSQLAVTDDQIYAAIDVMNYYYNMATPPAGIINPFKKYVGNAHITFHLANLDPDRKPTRGIVRVNTYLSNGGDEAAKIAPWAPDQYLNIYLENFIGRGVSNGIVLAYATFPTSYLSDPLSQGVISRADRVTGGGLESTLSHEVGHFLYLYHPWNSNGRAVEDRSKPIACGDDEVDDTPPTIGHFSCPNSNLFDTLCAGGYMKSYDNFGYYLRTGIQNQGGIIDYPDTTNTQNVMDYSDCSTQMFTKGQIARMRAALRSDVGMRKNLVSATNLVNTGITDASGNILPRPDITPTANFSVDKSFVCADGASIVRFFDRSYNDTTTVSWTFGGGATSATSTSKTVVNSFSTPGWVEVSQTATGNNTGSNTLTRKDLVYAASTVAINPTGYFENFTSGGDLDQYPIFNYYGTDFKWSQVNNAGYFDNSSMMFSNFDDRIASDPTTRTKTPGGLYADFFTPAFDLSGFGSVCNLTFFTAGAFRTTQPKNMTDRLIIYASNDCGNTWYPQDTIEGGNLGNNGLVTTPFTPAYNQWKEQSVPVDRNGVFTGAKDRVYFKFRFFVGTDFPVNTGLSLGTGNNFYLDRLHITDWALGVKNGIIVNLGMTVSPNPTSGAATVDIIGGDNSEATMTVSDVTGKVVYQTKVNRAATHTKIEIPATAIAVKGMYLVKVVTNGATDTKKLVVY